MNVSNLGSSVTKSINKEVLLSTMKPGESGVVSDIRTTHVELKSRLLTFGLVKDTIVLMKSIAPLGDPISIEVRGFCLSLRKVEADAVIIAIQE
jgi:ferrous iron transport protein A